MLLERWGQKLIPRRTVSVAWVIVLARGGFMGLIRHEERTEVKFV
jgi:hypothetical protein